MDIELEKLKKLEHALHDAIDILRNWQTGEEKPERTVVVAKRCSGCAYERCSATREPCVSCKPEDSKYEVKKCRPYESSAEMISDYLERFNVSCTSYCEPLIWLKSKIGDSRRLVTAFEEGLAYMLDLRYSMQELFEHYAYLDGSPVGMEL